MGPWVGGSFGQLCGGVLECTGPTGRIQTCQLVVQTMKCGVHSVGSQPDVYHGSPTGCGIKPVKVSIQ